MTIVEAAKVWLEEDAEIRAREARKKAAAEEIKAHLERTGKTDYRGKIGLSIGSRTQLDTPKVKAELGDRLAKFEKRITYTYLVRLK